MCRQPRPAAQISCRKPYVARCTAAGSQSCKKEVNCSLFYPNLFPWRGSAPPNLPARGHSNTPVSPLPCSAMGVTPAFLIMCCPLDPAIEGCRGIMPLPGESEGTESPQVLSFSSPSPGNAPAAHAAGEKRPGCAGLYALRRWKPHGS